MPNRADFHGFSYTATDTWYTFFVRIQNNRVQIWRGSELIVSEAGPPWLLRPRLLSRCLVGISQPSWAPGEANVEIASMLLFDSALTDGEFESMRELVAVNVGIEPPL
jgi:hypothetical protein